MSPVRQHQQSELSCSASAPVLQIKEVIIWFANQSCWNSQSLEQGYLEHRKKAKVAADCIDVSGLMSTHVVYSAIHYRDGSIHSLAPLLVAKGDWLSLAQAFALGLHFRVGAFRSRYP